MGGGKMDVVTSVASSKTSMKTWLGYGALLAALIILPVLTEGFGMFFMTRIFAVVGLYVMLALGLNIVVGFAGLLDLGYIAFYAIGSYAGVLVGTYVVREVPALGPYTFMLMIPVAAAFAALAGIALGTPVLRLRGDYLAIVTLGFGEIVRVVITNDPGGMTGGPAGIPSPPDFIPTPLFFDWLKQNVYFEIPGLGPDGFSFSFSNNLYWYFVILMLCIIAIQVVNRLVDSRLGRSWIAMREDEVAAASMGVSIVGAKLWAFSLGAVWGGIAGLVFANYQGFVSPESFTFMESVFVVVAVVLGGMGSIPGAIIGALIVQGIPEFIRGFASAGFIKLSADQVTLIGNYRNLVFGIVLVVFMIWRPQGIMPSRRRAAELNPDDLTIVGEENETLYDAQHDTAELGGKNQF